MWTTEYKNSIEDVYCPTCENENCVYVSTSKDSSFYDCKNCKASCHVLNFPCKKQKPTLILFSGDGLCCFAKKTSGDYGKASLLLENLLHQLQSTATEPEPKEIQSLLIWSKLIAFELPWAGEMS